MTPQGKKKMTGKGPPKAALRVSRSRSHENSRHGVERILQAREISFRIRKKSRYDSLCSGSTRRLAHDVLSLGWISSGWRSSRRGCLWDSTGCCCQQRTDRVRMVVQGTFGNGPAKFAGNPCERGCGGENGKTGSSQRDGCVAAGRRSAAPLRMLRGSICHGRGSPRPGKLLHQRGPVG